MKTTALLVACWIIAGLAVELGFTGRLAAQRFERERAEIARRVEIERGVARRNLEQAERFAIMCLDPALKYAYLGDIVVECRARVTRHRVSL